MTTPVTSPEMTALFNPFNGQLEQLFSYIDIGDLGLPDIQRPFVWKDSKVRDLLDSIYKGFPIGSYLFWRKTLSGKTHQIGTGKKEHDDPVLLIIDGQQRLTALYAVFRNQSVRGDDYENRKIVIAFNPQTEEFRVADASTGKNPEYIKNISDYLTRGSTLGFINGYLDQLKKYYAQLQVKQAAIRKKVEQDVDLTKQDIELITNKIKGQPTISDDERTILDKLVGSKETEPEDDEQENGDLKGSHYAFQSETSFLSSSEK